MNNSLADFSPTLQHIFSKLLQFDTVSRNSNIALIRFIEEYLDNLCIPSQLIMNDEQTKANLYARLGPQIEGGIMLSGHTDVVPIEGQDWTVEPFKLTELDGKCYGRGSTDMKGFIACVLDSIPQFKAANLRLPLHLAFSYDEEIGCLGVQTLIDHLNSSPEKPAMCIVGEPTSMQPVYGHKGKVAIRCKVHGHSCHSAYAPQGVNAIEYAAKLVNKLSEIRKPLKDQKDKRFAPPYSTLQTGVIKGGTSLNIVPEHCHFDLEMRYLPQTDPIASLGELQDYAQHILEPEMQAINTNTGIQFEVLATYPPLLTDPQSEFAQWVADWSDNQNFDTVAFGTEGGLFNQAGVATIVCGPGSMEQGHKPDEFITVEQLKSCSHMLENLRDWMST